jgi:hypothetical protein
MLGHLSSAGTIDLADKIWLTSQLSCAVNRHDPLLDVGCLMKAKCSRKGDCLWLA